MTTKTLQALLIGALLASSAAFADQSIEVSVVNGKQQAAFSVDDSKCRRKPQCSSPKTPWR